MALLGNGRVHANAAPVDPKAVRAVVPVNGQVTPRVHDAVFDEHIGVARAVTVNKGRTMGQRRELDGARPDRAIASVVDLEPAPRPARAGSGEGDPRISGSVGDDLPRHVDPGAGSNMDGHARIDPQYRAFGHIEGGVHCDRAVGQGPVDFSGVSPRAEREQSQERGGVKHWHGAGDFAQESF